MLGELALDEIAGWEGLIRYIGNFYQVLYMQDSVRIGILIDVSFAEKAPKWTHLLNLQEKVLIDFQSVLTYQKES